MKKLTYTLAISIFALSGTAMNTAHANEAEGGISEYKVIQMQNKHNTASSKVNYKGLNNDEGVASYQKMATKKTMKDIAPASGQEMSTKPQYNTDLFD